MALTTQRRIWAHWYVLPTYELKFIMTTSKEMLSYNVSKFSFSKYSEKSHFLHKMFIAVKYLTWSHEKHNNNKNIPIYTEAALNLFINTNAQELLKEMKPELKRDLAEKMSRFLDNVFQKIPYDDWIVD